MKGLTQALPQGNNETEPILSSKKKSRKIKMPEIEKNKLYTIGEAAEILRMSISTIRRRLTSDPPELGHIFDGTYRIPGKNIVEYLERHYRVFQEGIATEHKK